MNTLAALTLLNGLLASATQISQLIQNAHAQGRATLTPEEWASVIATDDIARKMLADAIAKAIPAP